MTRIIPIILCASLLGCASPPKERSVRNPGIDYQALQRESAAYWAAHKVQKEEPVNVGAGQLIFENLRGGLESEWYTISGRVRNTGATDLSWVKVEFELLNPHNSVIGKHTTYVTGTETLRPTESMPFRTVVHAGWNADVRTYQYRVFSQ